MSLRPAECPSSDNPQCRKAADELIRKRLPSWSLLRGSSSVTVPPSGKAPDGIASWAMRLVTIAPERDLVQVAVTRPRRALAIPKRVDGDGLVRAPVIGSA